jgi:hypothetical protein
MKKGPDSSVPCQGEEHPWVTRNKVGDAKYHVELVIQLIRYTFNQEENALQEQQL